MNKHLLLLGDRIPHAVTHRELEAAIDQLPDGVRAHWVGTDTPEAWRTADADGVWVVPGSPYCGVLGDRDGENVRPAVAGNVRRFSTQS